MNNENIKIGYYVMRIHYNKKQLAWFEKYVMTTYSKEEGYEAQRVLNKVYPNDEIKLAAFVYNEGEENNGPKWKAGRR